MSRSSKTLCRRDLLKAGLAGTAGLASRPLAAFSEPLSPVLPLPEPQQTNASAQELSWEEQISLRRLQPVRTVVDEVPVYAFGDTFIYAITPTLVGESRLQEGNASPARKIKPKKSWELKSNTFGATAPRVPRSEINDYQPFVGVNLIDGNPETCWMSRGQNQPDVEPVWVRIDLAKETQAKKVVLVPRWDNQGLPNDLVVQVSRDGWHWDTVFTDTNFRASHASGRFEIAFPARQIKQVMVRANNCSEVNVPDQYGEPTWTFDFCFSLAGIEVLEENDANVALISRGAGVTVSSTTRGFGDEKLLHDQLWPIHYDLGLKWVRVAYWDSVLNWLYVEQEKGKRRIDPWTDKVITECCRNGINVVLCLAYGNWNYTPEGHRPHPRQIFETPWEMPPAPTTPEMLEGYKEFVRFMVRHFRDRIRYFEIWNEPDGKYAWGNKPNPAEYAELVKQIAPIIRAEAPNCKILMAAVGFRPGKPSEYLNTCLEAGMARLVDVMTIHPYYGTPQENQDYVDYPEYVQAWKTLVESHGFRGEYMATESGWYAPYPKPVHPFANQPSLTELVKAKYLAKFMVTNAALGLTAFWNETWQDQFTYWDGSLLRSTFSADPVCPLQPQPAYYVMRILCTTMEDAVATDLSIETEGIQQKTTSFSFGLPDGSCLAAIWLPGPGRDEAPDLKTDLRVTGKSFTSATGIDLLNGTEQELQMRRENLNAVLPGVLIKDYPLLIRFR